MRNIPETEQLSPHSAIPLFPPESLLFTHQGHRFKYELIMSFTYLNSSNGYIYNGTKPKFLRKALYSSLISSCTTLSPTPPAPPACLPSLKHYILISAFWPLPLLFCLLDGSQHQCHFPRETFQTFPASPLGSSYPQAASDLSKALASIRMYFIVSMANGSIYYSEGFSRDRDFYLAHHSIPSTKNSALHREGT